MLDVGVCRKSLVSRVIFRGSRATGTTSPTLQMDLLLVMVQRLGSYGYANLAPSDSHHFGSLMKHLINKLFVTDGDVKQAVTYWQQALGTCVFYPPPEYELWCQSETDL